MNRKLYLELGYSSINQYARQELNFGNSKIGDYIKLTKKLEKLPNLKDSMSNGKVGYTKGRLIVDVADENTEKEWTEFAQENSRRKVEEEVKRARQEAQDTAALQPSFLPSPRRKTPAAVVPVRVNIEMTPAQFARYEKAWEEIRKQGSASPEKVEALLEIMESYLDGGSQNISPREKNSTNCRPTAQTPGCNHTRFLEIHHVVPRSRGGSNELSNLRAHCSACHARIHAHGSNLMVKSSQVIYSWNQETNPGNFGA